MRFIGITGGIGAGKSEILKFIRDHYKCEIYLADEVAHFVKEPMQPAYLALIDLLGTDILEEDADGSRKVGNPIDKGRMANKIFSDADLLKETNAIIHPAVKDFLLDKLAKAKAKAEGNEADAVELFFVEAALLLETGYKELVDEMWYIYASVPVRSERLRQARGYSDEKIASIMQQQKDEAFYRQGCDFVIDNSGDLEDSCRQIRKKLEDYTWLG